MKIRPVSVAVVVKDRRRSARWYQEKLGLKVLADEKEHWTVVGRPKSGLQIHLCEFNGAKGPTAEQRDTGILLLVDRPMPKAARSLSKLGVTWAQEPVEQPWGWVAKIQDPDGNVLTLMDDA